jgi:hypothetical protein
MGHTSEDATWASIRSTTHWSPEQAQWVIAELRRSGLSANGFAAKYKIGLKRIYYWRARFEARASRTEGRAELVEVQVAGPAARGSTSSIASASSARIEIELLSGRRLSVSESVDLEQLGKLVAFLERA